MHMDLGTGPVGDNVDPVSCLDNSADAKNCELTTCEFHATMLLQSPPKIKEDEEEKEKILNNIDFGTVKSQGFSGQETPSTDGEEQEDILVHVRFLEQSCSTRIRSIKSNPIKACTTTAAVEMSLSVDEGSNGTVLQKASGANQDSEQRLSLGKIDGNKGNKVCDQRDTDLSGEKNMRSSPRLKKVVRNSGKRKRSVDLEDGNCPRRSPRLSSLDGDKNLKATSKQENSIQSTRKCSKVTSISIKVSSTLNLGKAITSSEKSYPRRPETRQLRTSLGSTAHDSEQEWSCTSCDVRSSQSEQKLPAKKFKVSAYLSKNKKEIVNPPSFVGDPISIDEAQERWGWRYELKNKMPEGQMLINDDEEDETVINVKCHYAQASVGNYVYNLGDCACIQGEGERNHVGRIVEFFETTDGEMYFRVQWFYRIEDTVIKKGDSHDRKRLFYSSIMNDNLIDCIIEKVNVTQVTPKVGLKFNSISSTDFYYDMEYCVDYSTFRSIQSANTNMKIEPPSVTSNEVNPSMEFTYMKKKARSSEVPEGELALLDLYSGCGGMSTGLCLGAKVSSANLVTRWALDMDESACESLKLNHPETKVRNESAKDFLNLLREWEKLCKRYKDQGAESKSQLRSKTLKTIDTAGDEFEVSRLVDICYGDPNGTGSWGLNFMVHWKGYSASEDTWEPIDGLRNCQEAIKDFVRNGMKMKILPLPGEVGVICGGPPCQGISGYNRHRNVESPLDDEKNHQIVIFMDIVNFLKPKYVLMENVVDMLKFDKGSLGRYALSRLVRMRYQARLGMIVAGCYGLAQFRMRVFLWGAHPSEVLPPFPLPSHDVIIRCWPPPEFERNTVAYDEDQSREVEEALVLQDALSDLPPVTNDETREEMAYEKSPQTEFQRYIRSSKHEMTGCTSNQNTKGQLLYDHRPIPLHKDDYLRVCQIPKRKGANFRDLPGIVVGPDNVVHRDPSKNVLLPSGKPMVPDYCLTFERGKSKRPFARLWWDETVPTVLTYPNHFCQALLHPEQDRILTVREFARLQGFPDYYTFCGTLKQRYRQIGNAVAIPVARALGYSLGLAHRKQCGNEHLITLPPKFSLSTYLQLTNSLPKVTD